MQIILALGSQSHIRTLAPTALALCILCGLRRIRPIANIVCVCAYFCSAERALTLSVSRVVLFKICFVHDVLLRILSPFALNILYCVTAESN